MCLSILSISLINKQWDFIKKHLEILHEIYFFKLSEPFKILHESKDCFRTFILKNVYFCDLNEHIRLQVQLNIK